MKIDLIERLQLAALLLSADPPTTLRGVLSSDVIRGAPAAAAAAVCKVFQYVAVELVEQTEGVCTARDDLGALATSAKRSALALLFAAKVAEEEAEPVGSPAKGARPDEESDGAHCPECDAWEVECTCDAPAPLPLAHHTQRTAALVVHLAERVAEDPVLAAVVSPESELGRHLCGALAEGLGRHPREVMRAWRSAPAPKPVCVVTRLAEPVPVLASASEAALAVWCEICGAKCGEPCYLGREGRQSGQVHGPRRWVGEKARALYAICKEKGGGW